MFEWSRHAGGQRNGFGNAMSGMRNCKNRYRAISICIDYHTDSKDCKTDMLFIAYSHYVAKCDIINLEVGEIGRRAERICPDGYIY